jgi:nucleoside-diphosphate-sugar epimerase
MKRGPSQYAERTHCKSASRCRHRVLVTGAGGFVGSCVVGLLAAHEQVDVVALVRRTTNLERLVGHGALGSARLAYADLTDADEVRELLRRERPRTVVHLAMAYHPPGSMAPFAVEDVNCTATKRLFEEATAAGASRFIAAGTCFEYGPQQAQRLDETLSCRPVYAYASAKLRAAEAVLARAAKLDCDCLWLRVFSPYGPHEQPGRIVPLLLAASLAGRRLALSPGEQVRDYTYVDDVARAFVLAATRSSLLRPRGIYNVCTGLGRSLRELAEEAADAVGRRPDLAWGAEPYRPQETMRLVGSPRRIAEELGWYPYCRLDEGLRRTVHWMLRTPEAMAVA